jgi:hypothetical protein
VFASACISDNLRFLSLVNGVGEFFVILTVVVLPREHAMKRMSLIGTTLIGSVAVISAIAPSNLWARSDEVPTIDVRPVCRGIASQSIDPGVGQGAQAETFRRCLETEAIVREQLKKEWFNFSAADKEHCVALAKTGGESSNTELLTCLEMARDVRVQRSATATRSAIESAKPRSSEAAPAVQQVPAGLNLKATTQDKETLKAQDQSKREVEQARAEAQAAKALEDLAKLKLSDAEAALKQAKEETGRAIAEAGHAKLDAQGAREAEAAAVRKLVDAEAARAKAEQACHSEDKTEPGKSEQSLGGRLRKLFGRQSPSNP